jgi:predicted CXXCH cytochrome family protein
MVRRIPESEAAPALPEAEPVVQRTATCLLCHTRELSLSNDALAAGGGWLCRRCGQRWDARRLSTVAAYAAWARERDVSITTSA